MSVVVSSLCDIDVFQFANYFLDLLRYTSHKCFLLLRRALNCFFPTLKLCRMIINNNSGFENNSLEVRWTSVTFIFNILRALKNMENVLVIARCRLQYEK